MLTTTKIDGTLAIAKARQLAASGTGRAVRKAAGLSLQHVADACGAGSRTTVFNWETGLKRPSGEPAIAYAELITRLLEER